MKPTEMLTQEHNTIKVMLEIMEYACQELESGQKVHPEHLEQMVQFIREFADKCHHGKEEGLLFPALEKAGILREGGPIGVMLADHDQGRAYVKGLAEKVAKHKAGDASSSEGIIENARSYIALLTHHIFKEDNILFPMADRMLAESVSNQLAVDFNRVETDIIGSGKHEELHKILAGLKSIYLK
jgi:hemerythrin-like domain-containing protein